MDNQWARDRLRQLLGAAPEAFNALIAWDGDSVRLLDHYTLIALCNEMAAIRILQMPFLEEFDVRDYYAIGLLSYMARTDADGLEELLDHPDFQQGITDGHDAKVGLFHLRRHNPAAADALEALPWVSDLLASSAQPSAIGNGGYLGQFKELVYIGKDSPRSFNQLIDRAWVKDGRALLNISWVESGCGRVGRSVLSRIALMSRMDGEAAAAVLGMPLFESIGQGEWSTVDIVVGLLNEDFGRGFKWLLAQPAVADGITDDERAVVALLDLEWRVPGAAAALRALPWVKDGVGPTEDEGVLVLRKLALESDLISDALLPKSWVGDNVSPSELPKSWVRDGIIPTEARVIELLIRLDEAISLTIAEMPFMDSIEGLDLVALCSLWELEKRTDTAYLKELFTHDRLQGGITDELTSTVANLVALWDVRPDMVQSVLDSEPELVERRTVTLPYSGEVELGVIKAEGGTDLTMDLLEHALRIQEEFMGVPFPKDYATLLIADLSNRGGRGGYDARMIVDRAYEEDLAIIAHELAHTYWHHGPNWIVEGGAEFLSFVSESSYTGAPLPDPQDSCSLTDNLAELTRLSNRGNFDGIYFSGCDYILGRGLFLDLHRNLEDEVFRRGFGNLYLAMWNVLTVGGDEKLDKCSGIDAGLCYLREAFVADAPQDQATIADDIITRRYYGSP